VGRFGGTQSILMNIVICFMYTTVQECAVSTQVLDYSNQKLDPSDFRKILKIHLKSNCNRSSVRV